MKKYILFILTPLAFATISCGNKKAETATEEITLSSSQIILTEKQFQNAKIQIGALETRAIKTQITLKGTLDVPPQNVVHITPPYGGYLKHTAIMVGNKVQQGEVLATLEHPDYIQLQQDYLDAEEKLTLAEAELNRQKTLAKEQLNATKNVQQAIADFQIFRNQKEALSQKLSLINISSEELSQSGKISKSVALISPISGSIQAVNANIGKYVQPTDVLFEIVNTDHMNIALSAFEKDVNLLKIGQKIQFYLPNNDNKLRTGNIHLIGRSLNNDKTLPIHAHIDHDDAKLLPGMFVTAIAEVNNTQGNSLPLSAVIDQANQAYIFEQISTLEYQIIPVKIVVQDANYCQIEFLNNLPQKNKIVLKGANALYYRWKAKEE